MSGYSQYIELLYDQRAPVGSLGGGTHYSVLRAPIWQDRRLGPLERARFHDFALIWDEDHDERIVPVIERILFASLLSPILFIGERKGRVSVILAPESSEALGRTGLSSLGSSLEPLCYGESDSWSFKMTMFGDRGSSIINDSAERVDLYLRTISMLWSLGPKPTERVHALPAAL